MSLKDSASPSSSSASSSQSPTEGTSDAPEITNLRQSTSQIKVIASRPVPPADDEELDSSSKASDPSRSIQPNEESTVDEVIAITCYEVNNIFLFILIYIFLLE